MSDTQYEAALRLLKRIDSTKISENLVTLISLEPNLSGDLLNDVDQPLVVKSPTKGKDFLCCDYNRDGDNYRSPWDNTYHNNSETAGEGSKQSAGDSKSEELYFPSEELREYEKLFNSSFEIYKDMYYEQGSCSSCYLWETEDSVEDGFSGCILFKKKNMINNEGDWNSIHVFEILKSDHSNTEFEYRVTSTILLDLKKVANKTCKSSIGGNLQRQTERSVSLENGDCDFNKNHLDIFHLTNLGNLVEDIENKLRTVLEVVYFDKSINIYRNLVNDSSDSSTGDLEKKTQKELQEDLVKGIEHI